ncbi:MAG: hypothetical protein P8N02_16610, partial [Actinomycetota bacterium]|nr:hypothetical protein [Actinomycetota bacterium]
RKGSPCLVGAHAPFVIDEDASAAWMDCMSRALVDVGTAEKYRELIEPAFGRIADMMRNDA